MCGAWAEAGAAGGWSSRRKGGGKKKAKEGGRAWQLLKILVAAPTVGLYGNHESLQSTRVTGANRSRQVFAMFG